MLTRIETSADQYGESQPIGLFLGNKHFDIIYIIDRWPSADRSHFKVLADDGSTYLLRHDKNPDQWDMTFFEAAHRHDEAHKRDRKHLK